MSTPIFFEPWKLRDTRGKTHLIVDGGLLSNYPIWMFHAPIGEDPAWPTFGFDLFGPGDKADGHLPFPEEVDEIKPLFRFGSAIWNTQFSAMDRRYIAKRHWARTIAIDNCGTPTTQFDVSPQNKDRLWESGVEAARRFMGMWGDPQEGFERWKADYHGQIENAQLLAAEHYR